MIKEKMKFCKKLILIIISLLVLALGILMRLSCTLVYSFASKALFYFYQKT